MVAGGSIHSPNPVSTTAPAVVSYTKLPAIRTKTAPKTYKGSHHKLNAFLEHFNQVCTDNKVTDDVNKCKGLIRYCSDDIADTIESLDAYVNKDYTALIKEIRWLYDGDRRKAQYHTGDLEKFTRMWREEEIMDLETFLIYQTDFTKLAGFLKHAGHIDKQTYNRGFWEGLHVETRRDLERRMQVDDP